MSKTVIKQVRKQYSPEFRKQALVRADQDGVAVTAKELGRKRPVPAVWTLFSTSGSGLFVTLKLHRDVPRQQFADPMDRMFGDVREHVA